MRKRKRLRWAALALCSALGLFASAALGQTHCQQNSTSFTEKITCADAFGTRGWARGFRAEGSTPKHVAVWCPNCDTNGARSWTNGVRANGTAISGCQALVDGEGDTVTSIQDGTNDCAQAVKTTLFVGL